MRTTSSSPRSNASSLAITPANTMNGTATSTPTTTITAATRRQRRRQRRRRVWWQRMTLGFWVLLGLLSYGIAWTAMQSELNRAPSYYVNVAMVQEQRQRLAILWEEHTQRQQLLLLERQKTIKDGTNNIHATRNNINSNNKDVFVMDWTSWGLVACFLLVAYCRIQLEPNRSITNNNTLQDNDDGLLLLTPQQRQEAMLRTLRRVNQERQAVGQPPISMEVLQAFQQALLRDRALWRGLAVSGNTNNQYHHNNNNHQGGGATRSQLATCRLVHLPKEKADEDDSDAKMTVLTNNTQQQQQQDHDHDDDCCSICLDGYRTLPQVLRILPCGHSFHSTCIERWLQQSTLCPICKTPLA